MSLGLPKYCSVLKSEHMENAQVNTNSLNCNKCIKANVIIKCDTAYEQKLVHLHLAPSLLGLLQINHMTLSYF